MYPRSLKVHIAHQVTGGAGKRDKSIRKDKKTEIKWHYSSCHGGNGAILSWSCVKVCLEVFWYTWGQNTCIPKLLLSKWSHSAGGRKEDGNRLIPWYFCVGFMSCHYAQLKILRSCFITRKIWYLEMMLRGPCRICFLYVLYLFLICV